MKALLSLLLFFFASQLCAQQAPDFTITASDGQSHTLYADYLDNGKTVVIEMMFTTCPPCNSFAPFMEPLNEKWGGGQHDVVFFSLSTQNFDDNADVGNWLANHGATFPGAGKDGGALEALQPYLDGQFGPYFGTPAFIVIAPDGTVNFNVGFGQLGQAKADAISDAIAATGAQLPPVNVHVTGTVTTPDGTPIGSTTFTVKQDADTILTANQLDFYMDATPGLVYSVIPEKLDSLPNGVTTFDMVLIAKHILAVDTLDFWQILAADINNSSSVSTLDMVTLRKWILGQIFIQPSWVFYNSACDPAIPGSCAIEFSVQPGDTLVTLSIYGVKKGDVNYSANPGFGNDSPPSDKLFAAKEASATAAFETISLEDRDLKPGVWNEIILKGEILDIVSDPKLVWVQGAAASPSGNERLLVKLAKPSIQNKVVLQLKMKPELKVNVHELIKIKPLK
ncbi:MAG: hypothetical protein Kow0027_05360 [Saprospiraceae bacterium]